MKWLNYVFFIFIIITFNSVFPYTITVRVLDKTGSAVKGSVIGIEELKIIKYTDNNGIAKFDKISPNFYHLYIVHPLYGKKIIKIKLKRDFYIEFYLKKHHFVLKNISNNYFPIYDRFGSQYVTQENIKDLPGKWIGDSLHILQTLPGVGSAASIVGVPLIHGTSPLYDRYYIDDLPIDYPYHLIGVFSSFSEDIIDKATVIKGPYPLYYDDSIGSIINIKTKTVDRAGFHGSVIIEPLITILPIFPTVTFQFAPIKDLSILFSGRRTYWDWTVDYILPHLGTDTTDLKDNSNFYLEDYYLKVQYNLFNNHRLYVIAIGSKDYASMEDFKADFGFHTEAIKWEFLINKNMFLKTIFSDYVIKQELSSKKDIEELNGKEISFNFNPLQYRLFQMLYFTMMNYYIKAGYELIYHKDGAYGNLNLYDLDTDLLDKTGFEVPTEFLIEGFSYAIFAEGGLRFDELWTNIGVRYKHYGPLNNNSISYRTMIGYDIQKKYTVYVGGGAYNAYPEMYYYLGTPQPNFKDEKNINGLLGVKSKFAKHFIGQIELFYVKYKDLMGLRNLNETEVQTEKVITDGTEYVLSLINPYGNVIDGDSYGMEVYLRGRYKFLLGWVSYTYSVSKRTNSDLDLNDYYSYFDQTHILRIVLEIKKPKWSFSLIWHYYTPVPHTDIVGSKQNDDGTYDPIYGDFNEGRYDPHHRLDIKYRYNFGSGVYFYFEIWDIYGIYRLLNDGGNALIPDFDDSRPYGPYQDGTDDDGNPIMKFNPDTTKDLPGLWLGLEIRF